MDFHILDHLAKNKCLVFALKIEMRSDQLLKQLPLTALSKTTFCAHVRYVYLSFIHILFLRENLIMADEVIVLTPIKVGHKLGGTPVSLRPVDEPSNPPQSKKTQTETPLKNETELSFPQLQTLLRREYGVELTRTAVKIGDIQQRHSDFASVAIRKEGDNIVMLANNKDISSLNSKVVSSVSKMIIPPVGKGDIDIINTVKIQSQSSSATLTISDISNELYCSSIIRAAESDKIRIDVRWNENQVKCPIECDEEKDVVLYNKSGKEIISSSDPNKIIEAIEKELGGFKPTPKK